MEKINRKEAFECAIAQFIATTQVVNNGKDKLYDYALCLQKGSLSPIICLKPGDYFQWNDDIKYGQKSYAFLPIQPYTELIIRQCGTNSEYYGTTVTIEKFKAIEHPASWIKETLTKKYIKLSYFSEMLIDSELVYDTSFFSKTHSTWIRLHIQEDGDTIYFPYYTSSERKRLFDSSPSLVKEIYEDYWED